MSLRLSGPSQTEERRVLVERAQRLAMPAAESRDEDLVALTGFVIAGDRYALENRFIRAVVPAGDPTALPGAPAWVLGLTNFRGEVVLVIDLRRLFELPPIVRSYSHLVVCGIEAIELAIAVDAVDGTPAVSAADIEPVPATLPRAFPELVRGITTDTLTVLDGAALLEDGRLRLVGSEPRSCNVERDSLEP